MSKSTFKQKLVSLKREVYVLFLASRDPRVPWYVKALMVLTIGYAICPIDLIPDFIPILGQLDDLVIIPALIALIVKLVPKNVLDEHRKTLSEQPINSRTKWIIATLIVLIWLFILYLFLDFLIFLLKGF